MCKKTPKIGFAFSTPCTTPTDNSPLAIEIARQKSFAFTRERFTFETAWWADPIFLGDYPQDAYSVLKSDMPNIKEGDMELIFSLLTSTVSTSITVRQKKIQMPM